MACFLGFLGSGMSSSSTGLLLPWHGDGCGRALGQNQWVPTALAPLPASASQKVSWVQGQGAHTALKLQPQASGMDLAQGQ